MRQFTYTELRDLRVLLLSAFTPFDFPRMLADRMGIAFHNEVPLFIGFEDQLFDFLGKLNHKDQVYELLNAVVEARPKNEKLHAFAHKTGLFGAGMGNLEALVTKSPFYDLTKLMMRLAELSRYVCRIEIDDTEFGTGFLVGPDLVMTNYHVAKPFIQTPALAAKTKIRFDYRKMPDGVALYAGNVYALSAEKAVLAESAYDTLDEKKNVPISTPFPTDKLDYALLQLARAAGDEPAGPRVEDAVPNETTTRGWLKYPEPAPELGANDALFIVQHPQARPMEIAFDSNAILEYDPNKVRIRYKTNTEKGSSGSPCFNHKWQWVALHHSGSEGAFNQGIPVDKILKDLKTKGLLNRLTAEE
jgi:V8-like Glu-specific endopeptidase